MNSADIAQAAAIAALLNQAQCARAVAGTADERQSLDAACEKLAKDLKEAVGGAE